jgi:hypothetical protein
VPPLRIHAAHRFQALAGTLFLALFSVPDELGVAGPGRSFRLGRRLAASERGLGAAPA